MTPSGTALRAQRLRGMLNCLPPLSRSGLTRSPTFGHHTGGLLPDCPRSRHYALRLFGRFPPVGQNGLTHVAHFLDPTGRDRRLLGAQAVAADRREAAADMARA